MIGFINGVTSIIIFLQNNVFCDSNSDSDSDSDCDSNSDCDCDSVPMESYLFIFLPLWSRL